MALGTNTTASSLTAVGYQALSANTAGPGNTALGAGALSANTTAGQNTAVGANALAANRITASNVAVGSGALAAFNSNLPAEGFNVAVGAGSMNRLTNGLGNVALGFVSLPAATNTGGNVAIGYSALGSDLTGSNNTAVGVEALNQATGGQNIAVGSTAGFRITNGSNNIMIGNDGTTADDSIIRIGTVGRQTQFFGAGISGVSVTGVPVVVDANGQLGVSVVSSRRFKEEIEDMGDASSGLQHLRPVTFRYKQPYGDGTRPTEYGLVAEEVATIYPDLVVKGGANRDVTMVRYDKLTPLLLNELQKQNRENTELRQEVRELQSRLEALERLMSAKQ
jgi:hypothetical protein